MADHSPIIIKKKRASHGGSHHGGSWKVAYADFVTAMMAFFMVMWIMGLSQQTRSIIAGYFKDPFAVMKQEPSSKTIVAPENVTAGSNGKSGGSISPRQEEQSQFKAMKSLIRKTIESSKSLASIINDVRIVVTPKGLRIDLMEVNGSVFFNTGSSVLLPVGLQLVKRIAPVLAKADKPLIVEGHTDARPFANDTYNNWNLSTDRALSLQAALHSYGVGEGQFAGVRGYAATRLLDPTNPYDYRNRRVSIFIPREYKQGDLEMLPKDELLSDTSVPFSSDVSVGPTAPKIVPEKAAK